MIIQSISFPPFSMEMPKEAHISDHSIHVVSNILDPRYSSLGKNTFLYTQQPAVFMLQLAHILKMASVNILVTRSEHVFFSVRLEHCLNAVSYPKEAQSHLNFPQFLYFLRNYLTSEMCIEGS